jgi:hypothetical protein
LNLCCGREIDESTHGLFARWTGKPPIAPVRAWFSRWHEPAGASSRLTPGQMAAVKAGRWWPPLTAHQVRTMGLGRMRISPETMAQHEGMTRLEAYRTAWAEVLAQLLVERAAATTDEAKLGIEQRIQTHYRCRWPPSNEPP